MHISKIKENKIIMTETQIEEMKGIIEMTEEQIEENITKMTTVVGLNTFNLKNNKSLNPKKIKIQLHQ